MSTPPKKMHDLCEITSSKRIFASEYMSEGVPFYRSKEIIEKQSGKLDVSTEIFISESRFEEISDRVGAPQEGDLLLTSVGTLGVPYVVQKDERFYFKDGNLTWFRNFYGLDSGYLYYWLLSPIGKAELKKATIGSSQSAYTINLLGGLSISPHEIGEQRQIAHLLRTYDDLITANQRRIQLLEESARLLYREWFVKLKFPGYESIPVTDGVPAGWKRKQLGDICDDIRDTVDPNELPAGTPYLSMEHMPQRSLSLTDWDYAEKVGSTKLKFTDNDILFGKIRPYFHKVGIAPISGITSTDVITIRARNSDLLPLVALIVSSDAFVAHSVATSNGTKMPRADWKVLKKWQVFMPDPPLIAELADVLNPILEQIQNIGLHNRSLRQARDMLLPKLMSGALDVSRIAVPGEAAA
jgi:type I restriction enzyme S subunit